MNFVLLTGFFTVPKILLMAIAIFSGIIIGCYAVFAELDEDDPQK